MMSPPAQIPRIRPISSECWDTSRGRLLSLQAAAGGQGQAGRVGGPHSTPGGLPTSRMNTLRFIPWDARFSTNTNDFTKMLQGSAVPHYDHGHVPLSVPVGWDSPSVHLSSHPTKIIHPWIQHPAPPLQPHLHYGNSIKKENSTKGKNPDAKERGKQKCGVEVE